MTIPLRLLPKTEKKGICPIHLQDQPYYAAKSKDTIRRETKGQYLRWTYIQNS